MEMAPHDSDPPAPGQKVGPVPKAQVKKSKIPRLQGRPKAPGRDDLEGLSASVAALGLGPSQEDACVVLYDLETTGLGKTEAIGIVELGGPLLFPLVFGCMLPLIFTSL